MELVLGWNLLIKCSENNRMNSLISQHFDTQNSLNFILPCGIAKLGQEIDRCVLSQSYSSYFENQHAASEERKNVQCEIEDVIQY